MSEPQGHSPGERELAPSQAPDQAPVTGAPLLNQTGPTSADTPTVISQAQPRPLRPEEAFPAVLRGRKLAHFELIEPIGVGGMAAVVRARDLQLDRIVALKILPPETAKDPENVRRFQQEG